MSHRTLKGAASRATLLVAAALLAGVAWACLSSRPDVATRTTPGARLIPVEDGTALEDGTEAATRPLEDQLAAILRGHDGTYGVVIEHHPTGIRLEHNARRIFPSASVYKLVMACEVLRRVDRGSLRLDDRLTIDADDAVEPEPRGGPGPGDELTVREALRAAMAVSSNSASHALLRRLGRRQFNVAVAAIGLQDTRVPLDSDEQAVTTPADMAHLLRLLAREQILSDESRRELRQLLALREPLDPLQDALPGGTTVLAKAGNLERASNVAGLILTPTGPLTLAAFDEDVDPGEARETIGELARTAFEFYAR